MNIKLPRGKSYNCQEGRPWLKPGNVVWVQPGTLVDKPYLCIIKEDEIDWCSMNGEHYRSMRWSELCTYIPFKHGAVIWDYWVDRLSPANSVYTLLIRVLYRIEKMYKWLL